MSNDDGNLNGEVIDEANVNAAVVGVTYDNPDAAGASGGVTVDGFTATATITGGDPDEHRSIDWGDGTEEEFVLSDSGGQTASHTYAAAGTYTVTGKDSAGNVLTTESVTIVDPVPPPLKEDAFNPGAHNIADVETYVAAHPDERETVLAAEQAGKNRTSLVASLEAPAG